MKRCPQCSFLYLDSDQFCDLDKTPLIPDDFEHSQQKTTTPPNTETVHRRKLNLKTLSAGSIAGLIISLMLLFSYQRMRSTLQASQAPTTSAAQDDQVSRVSLIAEEALNETSARPATGQEDSQFSVGTDDTSRSVKPSPSPTSKTAPNIRIDSPRARVSSNPVSTGDVAKSGRAQITIRLADGSTLLADEVWRTKAGIWYRRKGIVTLLKPNRVIAISR